MATARTLESARGDVIVIEESSPERLRFQWRRPEGQKGWEPTDLHPTQRQVIKVLEGGLRAKVGGKQRECRAGDQVEIPAGVEHSIKTDPTQPFRAEVTFTPATGILEFFEDLMQLKPNPVALTRFSKRHRKAVRLAAPFGQIFDVMGVFIR
jgi:mannose-6-phosphate isomerase-like protein (cupin superfamily)